MLKESVAISVNNQTLAKTQKITYHQRICIFLNALSTQGTKMCGAMQWTVVMGQDMKCDNVIG